MNTLTVCPGAYVRITNAEAGTVTVLYHCATCPVDIPTDGEAALEKLASLWEAGRMALVPDDVLEPEWAQYYADDEGREFYELTMP